MRKFTLLLLFAFSTLIIKAQFATGNLAIFVAAANGSSNTTGSIVEINTTTSGQSAIRTYAIDGVTPPNALRFSGSATSTCYLTNTNDGSLLNFNGGVTTNTASNINTITSRGVGTFNSAGTFNLATTYTGNSGQQTRSATSINNTNWYIADQAGLYTNGATTFTQNANLRTVKPFGGLVYAMVSSVTNTFGTYASPTATTFTNLFNTSTAPVDFYLISSGSNGSAYDVAYFVTATNILKYSLVGASWAANGSVALSGGGFGICAKKNGVGADLFITTGSGSTSANNVIKLTDAAAYNTTISTGASTTLFTTAANTTIKGIAFAPIPSVSLSVSTATASETAATAVTVTATASSAVTGDQTVTVAVTGTNITTGDYTLSNATITIPNGATTGSVTFTVVDDILVEGTETATLTISNPSAGIAIGTPNSQDVTIADNDFPPTPTVDLSVSTNAASEAAATVVTVTATASAAVTGNQTVSLAVTGAGITAGDYTLSNTTITILNGAITGSITFTVVDDAIIEGTETATLTISSPSSGIALGSTLTQNISIADNDVAPTVNLSVSAAIGSETATTVITVTATASAAVAGDQTVALSVTGAGITGTDYTLSNTTITIPNGSTTGAVTFIVVDDAVIEGPEIATLTISSPSSGITLGAATTKTVNIIDNDVPDMRITEYMYNGSEFAEFTNVGATAIDMTGWSFDDNSRAPGSVNLSAFGLVQPGESVILSEAAASSFRSTWGLCSGVKIIGGNNNNLGGSDEINLYDASNNLVDRITYSTAGGPQANGSSAWVSTAALGANLITAWTLSTVADAEGSYTATGGFIGNPGKSTQATVSYDPCPPTPGAPTIVIDVAATTDLLDGGLATSPVSPYALSSVINDPIDPLINSGVNFTVGDDITPVAALTVTATSSNTTVVPLANIVITGNGVGAARNIKITGAAVGYSTITLTVTDGTLTTNYVIAYAASQAGSTTTKWHTGIADASAAIAIDDDYMIIGNDESNLLYVYNRSQSGLPVTTYDFNPSPANILNLTDGTSGNWKELDLEASVVSATNANRIYWLGSMSNSSSFNNKPNRNRIFATQFSGTGAATTFSNVGTYGMLRQSLINWGNANGYNFTASAADGKDSKTIDGFNVEGMVFAPNNTTLYIGFRAPFVPVGTRTKAVIAPILNFETWFNNGSPVGNPTYGAPIELDLGLRGIRDIIRISNGNYVIVAGSYGDASIPAIFKWTGNAGDAPVIIPSFDLTGINAEAAMPVNVGGLLSLNKLQIIADDGSKVFYNDAIEAKDLTQANFKKFSSDIIVSSAGGPLPITFDYFTATRQNNTTVALNWRSLQTDNVRSFEILRSVNGVDFVAIDVVPAVNGQAVYNYADNNATAAKLYYRIKAIEIISQSYLSTIRFIDLDTKVNPVKVYPNPVFNNLFTVSVNKTGEKTVQVYSVTGALYKTLTFTGQAKDIPTNGWPNGSYIIRIITGDGEITTQKLIVQ